MNFEEKTVRLPIGKMKVNEFDSTIKIHDFSIFALVFFIAIFGIVGYIFYDNRDKLQEIEINPFILLIAGLSLVYSMKEIFLSNNFAIQIRFNEVASISFEEQKVEHIISISVLVFYLFSGKKRSVWIREKDKKDLMSYFSSKSISIK